MGGGDLGYDVQAQNMRPRRVWRGILGSLGVKGGQHGKRVARTVVVHRDCQPALGRVGADRNRTAAGVVPRAVAEQVRHCAADQRRIDVDDGGLGGRGGGKADLAAGVAVDKIDDRAAQQRAGRRGGAAQRLRAVLQLTCQVQILDQPADHLPLRLDRPGHAALCGAKGIIRLEPLGIAEDQRKRGADIVADAGHPLGAGGVPPGDRLALAAQVGAGAVQLAGQRGGGPGFGQLHRAAFGQLLQTVFHPAQPAVHRPGQQRAGNHNQHKVQRQHRPHRAEQRLVDLGIHIEIVPVHAARRPAEHKNAILGQVAHDRVIVKIPPRERDNLARRVGMVERFGQVVAVDDVAVVIQHHRPGKAAEPLGRCVCGAGGGVSGFIQGEAGRNLAREIAGD